jgi:hypothetical protein
MNWTNDYPKKQGFYWLRNYQFEDDSYVDPAPVVVHVSESEYHRRDGSILNELFFAFTGDPGITLLSWLTSAEWYGPIDPPDQTNREHWLNGWHRQGDAVLLGGVHCAGCGKFVGTTCIALDDDPLPEKMPDFPFEEATCPLCAYRRMPDPPDAVDKLTERLERLKKRGPIEPPE